MRQDAPNSHLALERLVALGSGEAWQKGGGEVWGGDIFLETGWRRKEMMSCGRAD